jgi:hypothetical protein
MAVIFARDFDGFLLNPLCGKAALNRPFIWRMMGLSL